MTRLGGRVGRAIGALFATGAALAAPAHAAPAELLKDVNTATASSRPGDFVRVTSFLSPSAPGTLYYAADDGVHGRELFKTTISTGVTELVADINPGPEGSDPADLTVVASGPVRTIYFSADDGASGKELWKSNGSAAGTTLVKDIEPGAGDSHPDGITQRGGTLYFAATTTAAGREPYTSDGTGAGTALIDAVLGPGGSYPRAFAAIGTKVFFLADGTATGEEPWVTDGSAPGTHPVADIAVGTDGSRIRSFVDLGGVAYFLAADANDVVRLYSSSGTGVTIIKAFSSSPDDEPWLTNVGGTLYFAADGGNGLELFKSAGTAGTTSEVTNLDNGTGDSDPEWLTNVGGTLYFTATESHGTELWTSTGTAAGTTRLTDLPADADSFYRLTAVEDAVYFLVTGTSTPVTLWRSAPLGGTGPLQSFPGTPGTAGTLGELFNGGGTLFLGADDPLTGHELWRSDGTTPSTVQVGDLNLNTVSSTNGQPSVRIGDLTYFVGENGATGEELYRTDGTPAGTVLVKDISAGPQSSSPTELTAVGNTLYFSADDGVHGTEVWRSDGTGPGTTLVRDIVAGPADGDPSWLTGHEGAVYFSASDAGGRELWRSEGTEATTNRVLDINAGPGSAEPRWLQSAGGKLYFTAIDGVNGSQVWSTDGTSVSTERVTTIEPAAGGIDARWFRELGGNVFFMVSTTTPSLRGLYKTDGSSATLVKQGSNATSSAAVAGDQLFFVTGFAGSYELWRSDGTDAGTVKVDDVPDLILPTLVPAGGAVYFMSVGFDGSAEELWRSDGTVDGSGVVKELNPAGFNASTSLLAVNGIVYYVSGNYGAGQLVSSDGTSAGTRVITALQGASAAGVMGTAGDRLLFAAEDVAHGSEPWSVAADYDDDGVTDLADGCPTQANATPDGCAAAVPTATASPSASPTPTATPGGGGATPPKVTATAAKQRLGKTVSVNVTCQGAPCSVSVKATVAVPGKRKKAKPKKFTLATVTAALKADRKTAIEVKLSKPARKAIAKALKARRKVTVAFAVTATANGRSAVANTAARLTAPKKKKKRRRP